MSVYLDKMVLIGSKDKIIARLLERSKYKFEEHYCTEWITERLFSKSFEENGDKDMLI